MNIYEIAEKAGVSIATVSRVINNNCSVSEKTREKVLRIIDEESYRPNVFARGLVIDSMKLVGVICTDVSDIFIAKALSLLQKNLHERNYDTLLFCVGNHQTATLKHLYYLQSKHVDAIFLIGSSLGETDDQSLREIARSVPLIMINSSVNIEGIYSIYCDEGAGIREAVDLLYKKGSRKSYIIYNGLTPSTKRKIDGFKLGLKAHGVKDAEKYIICTEDSISGGFDAVNMLLSKNEIPDGVIAVSDSIAAGALKAFRTKDIKSYVIGFDNTIICECTAPPLSSIDPQIEEMCVMAADLLDKICKGEKLNKTYISNPKLVLRESF